MAWATDGVDQHDKNVLVVRGLFVCSPFFVLGELALCKSPRKITLCQKSNRKSDNVGLPLGEVLDLSTHLIA